MAEIKVLCKVGGTPESVSLNLAAKEGYNSLIHASAQLVNQLDEVRKNELYQKIFLFMAEQHGVVYNGPTFGIQLENLRNILNKIHRSPALK